MTIGKNRCPKCIDQKLKEDYSKPYPSKQKYCPSCGYTTGCPMKDKND